MTVFQTQLLAVFLLGFACGFVFLYAIAHLEAENARRNREAEKKDEPPQKGFGL